ncbi:MAG TPA: Crp/Fnr family transcriptional regulator [Polyangia bacterium]|nr:Crp/Fnr family transcriptional regulator [Polyangia bacterium]
MDAQAKNAARLFERFGRSYEGGETIFAEDDEAGQVYMILEGRVRVTKRVRLIERDISILKAGDMFGESALVRGHRRPASSAALGACKVLAFDAAGFEALLRDQPEIALKLIGQLVRRLHVAEERIENMMLRDSQSKIVNTLIKLSEAARPDDGGRILLQISPIELSSRIGLDVDSVKRGVLGLKDNGFVDIVGESIVVADVAALRKLYRLVGMQEELRRG